MRSKSIILIGMPGSGKTTFGQLLASEINLPFIDLDQLIENKINVSISDLWSEKGEHYFRCIERKFLLSILSGPQVVLSTGGGCSCFMDGMFWINKNVSIFLSCKLEVLMERLALMNRPILQNGITLRNLSELLNKRLCYYQQAQIILENNDGPKDLVNLLNSHPLLKTSFN